jgi:hypothetical protein
LGPIVFKRFRNPEPVKKRYGLKPKKSNCPAQNLEHCESQCHEKMPFKPFNKDKKRGINFWHANCKLPFIVKIKIENLNFEL